MKSGEEDASFVGFGRGKKRVVFITAFFFLARHWALLGVVAAMRNENVFLSFGNVNSFFFEIPTHGHSFLEKVDVGRKRRWFHGFGAGRDLGWDFADGVLGRGKCWVSGRRDG